MFAEWHTLQNWTTLLDFCEQRCNLLTMFIACNLTPCFPVIVWGAQVHDPKAHGHKGNNHSKILIESRGTYRQAQ